MSGTVGMGDLIRVAQIVESRGYAQTFQFKGIDDFLKGFKTLMADPSAGDGEENVS